MLRGYASHVLWGPFILPQVAFDRFIGAGETPTVRLQQWLFDPNRLQVWDYATWAVYTSHFFVSYTVAAVLWKRNHPRFKRFIALYVGLTFVGYAGYVLYPAMPPWLASDTGYIPAISRIVPVVWNNVGVHEAAALFLHGAKVANDIAAMPSLHAAYPMLLLLFFWPRARSWTRVLLVGYVLAMAFALVYLGEHFVIDELAGVGRRGCRLFRRIARAGRLCLRRWPGPMPVPWITPATRPLARRTAGYCGWQGQPRRRQGQVAVQVARSREGVWLGRRDDDEDDDWDHAAGDRGHLDLRRQRSAWFHQPADRRARPDADWNSCDVALRRRPAEQRDQGAGRRPGPAGGRFRR